MCIHTCPTVQWHTYTVHILHLKIVLIYSMFIRYVLLTSLGTGLHTEGIYRISGSQDEVYAIKADFDSGAFGI